MLRILNLHGVSTWHGYLKDLNPTFEPDSISLTQLSSRNIQYIPWWAISWVVGPTPDYSSTQIQINWYENYHERVNTHKPWPVKTRQPPCFKVTFVVVVSCHYLLSWKGRDGHKNQSMGIMLHKSGFHIHALCNNQCLFFVDDKGKGKTKGFFNEKSICGDWHWIQIVPPLEIKT